MDKRSLLFGMGIGIVLVSGIFYGGNKLTKNSAAKVDLAVSMTEDEIIESARALGMRFIKDLPDSSESVMQIQAVSDEAVIQRALELGYTPPLPADNETLEGEVNGEDVQATEAGEPETLLPEDDTKALVTVVIPPGSNAYDIADILFKEGIVEDSSVFHEYIIQSRKSKNLIAGDYEIEKGEDFEKILNIIIGNK